MIENREGRDEFIEAFRKQLEHVDDFIQTVLNAHLEVEGQLEKFLDRIFFHLNILKTDVYNSSIRCTSHGRIPRKATMRPSGQ